MQDVPFPIKILLAIVLIALMAQGASRIEIEAGEVGKLSSLQYLAFPVIMGLIYVGIRRYIAVPIFVVIATAVCATAAAAYNFGLPTISDRTLYVALFSDDHLEIESRLLREKIAEYASDAPVQSATLRVGRISRVVESEQMLSSVVRDNFDRALVIWGSVTENGANNTSAMGTGAGWLHLHIPARVQDMFGDAVATEIKDRSGLRVVSALSGIGLSRRPYEATARFITDLYSALLSTDREEKIAALNIVSSYNAPWSASFHRGYVVWLIGNYYLAESIRDPSAQRGYLKCAAKAYNRALRLLKGAYQPELLAALDNNSAIVKIMQASANGRKFRLRAVKTALDNAVRLSFVELNALPKNSDQEYQFKRDLVVQRGELYASNSAALSMQNKIKRK